MAVAVVQLYSCRQASAFDQLYSGEPVVAVAVVQLYSCRQASAFDQVVNLLWLAFDQAFDQVVNLLW